MRIVRSLIVPAAALFLLAACSGAPPTGNALVCQHYLTQRAWVKDLTQPTIADALQFETDVAVDAVQAAGTLRRDLNAMQASMAAGRSDFAASRRVFNDCG